MKAATRTGTGAVRLRGAGKRYRRGGPWVLREVDVELAAGGVVELRGANGSGKSTLLRLLAGASALSRGERQAAAGLRVGYGPERLPPPPFSAADYLGHHARIRARQRQGRAALEAEAAALAERLGCASLLAERMAALSKGSLQKVVLIQALLGGPGLIVLDEPFDGLDAAARLALGELIGERAGAGAAVVFSDHRRSAPRPRADREWLVAGGGVAVAAAHPVAPGRRFQAEPARAARVIVEAPDPGPPVPRPPEPER